MFCALRGARRLERRWLEIAGVTYSFARGAAAVRICRLRPCGSACGGDVVPRRSAEAFSTRRSAGESQRRVSCVLLAWQGRVGWGGDGFNSASRFRSASHGAAVLRVGRKCMSPHRHSCRFLFVDIVYYPSFFTSSRFVPCCALAAWVGLQLFDGRRWQHHPGERRVSGSQWSVVFFFFFASAVKPNNKATM